MAKSSRKKNPRTDPVEARDPPIQTPEREEELSGTTLIDDACQELYREVVKGFEDQYTRSNSQQDYWDIYNCDIGPKQFYSGSSKIFVPIVLDALTARKTRFTNQIFPVSGRYVEVTSSDGELPYGLMSLCEYYIRKAKLRTQVVPALMKCGDVEGHYHIYVTWRTTERHVVMRVKKVPKIKFDEDTPDAETFDAPGEEVDDIQEEVVTHGSPHVEVISDSDVCVLPATADSIDEALDMGGSATILRRWTKTKIKKEKQLGHITKEGADSLIALLDGVKKGEKDVDMPKHMTDAAGIKGTGNSKYALVYETWTILTVKDDEGGEEERRICRVYFGGEDQILSCKRNPYWSDHIPLISAPLEKVHGSFKGKSKVAPVADLQYQANDAVNEAMDSAAYALMPIVMTDPLKNPRIGSMILSMSAIWETSPKDTQFVNMPALWKDGLEIVSATKNQIMQSLGVNPSMITQSPQKNAKPNQAMVAQEQQVDILTTADVVTVVEEGILTPMLARFVELDHQFRDKELTVRQYGKLGQMANMEAIQPVQFDRHYQFRWFGVEAARNAQQVQQQVAGMNVLRGIPPEMLGGAKVNLMPIVSQLVENTYGPRLAPLIFEKPEDQMPVPVDQENMLLISGFEVPTHQMDDDNQHIQQHSQLMNVAQGLENVPSGTINKIQKHIWMHMQQAQRKQQQAQQQSMPQVPGVPGAPGGAGAGLQGQPRPGAQPGMPRGGQGPAGMIHQDRMQDPGAMPRKM